MNPTSKLKAIYTYQQTAKMLTREIILAEALNTSEYKDAYIKSLKETRSAIEKRLATLKKVSLKEVAREVEAMEL